MGMSCSCENKDDTKKPEGNASQGGTQQVQNKPISYNPNLANSDFQIMNRGQLEQAKKDAGLAVKVLVILFGRITDSKCKEVIPGLNRLINEKYSTQSCSLKIDCDNSQEILKDDVTETSRQYPWIKVYANLTFIGIVFENDEVALEALIQQGIVALTNGNGNNNNNNAQVNQPNEVPEQSNNVPIVEPRVYKFSNFFQGSYTVLQSAQDLNDAISKSLAEKKVLLINFSLEDETGERFAPIFENAVNAHSVDVSAAICNASVNTEVVSAAKFTSSSYPVVQTYTNGTRHQEAQGEQPDLETLISNAIASVIK
jgi:hypothetical protein